MNPLIDGPESYLREDILAILRASLDDGFKLRAIEVRCNVPDEVWDYEGFADRLRARGMNRTADLFEGWDADADRMDEAKPYG